MAKKKKKKTKKVKRARKRSRFRTDRRRKHRHWQVTVYYHDEEKFARVYIDRERAVRFAERQKKSPVVRATRILEVD
jgi:tRNA splicing endonuclease